jgi:hypothetical protein
MSSTSTNTFTITNAQYLASKIAADLRQMKSFYGQPSEEDIDKYVQELVILLKGGYISSVDYGFRKNGLWVLAISYAVNPVTGQLLDDNPGRVPPGRDVSGASWGSFLRYSARFYELTADERGKVESSLPFQRGGSSDPQNGLYGQNDKTYSSGGQQINRKIIG